MLKELLAALGGGAQALKAQDVDMAIGRRNKGDFDVGSALVNKLH